MEKKSLLLLCRRTLFCLLNRILLEVCDKFKSVPNISFVAALFFTNQWGAGSLIFFVEVFITIPSVTAKAIGILSPQQIESSTRPWGPIGARAYISLSKCKPLAWFRTTFSLVYKTCLCPPNISATKKKKYAVIIWYLLVLYRIWKYHSWYLVALGAIWQDDQLNSLIHKNENVYIDDNREKPKSSLCSKSMMQTARIRITKQAMIILLANEPRSPAIISRSRNSIKDANITTG